MTRELLGTTTPLDIQREAQNYGSDGPEGNMVLPKVAGFLVVTAAEQLGTPVMIDSEGGEDLDYRRIFPVVMGALERQYSAEAASRAREAAVEMIAGSGVGALAETLRLYMEQFKGLQSTSTAA